MRRGDTCSTRDLCARHIRFTKTTLTKGARRDSRHAVIHPGSACASLGSLIPVLGPEVVLDLLDPFAIVEERIRGAVKLLLCFRSGNEANLLLQELLEV